jgi:hypothetical protein
LIHDPLWGGEGRATQNPKKSYHGDTT